MSTATSAPPPCYLLVTVWQYIWWATVQASVLVPQLIAVLAVVVWGGVSLFLAVHNVYVTVSECTGASCFAFKLPCFAFIAPKIYQ